MPQVHTYIRNEDMDKWKALPNKSEFIHDALNGRVEPEFEHLPTATIKNVIEGGAKADKDATAYQKAALNIPGVVKGSDFVPKPPDPETGYPCCTRAKPCKHWVWSEDEIAWVNSLTGKIKEE